MQDIMPPVDTVDNLFHDGNPVTGEQGTIVSAEFLNNLQGATRDTQTELKSILTAAGIAVDPDKQNQVLTALSKLYLSRVNPGADIAADGAAAIATFLANLGLGEAAKRNVGTGANQIPDMSSYASGSGWRKMPDGSIEQWGRISFPGEHGPVSANVSFPIPFTQTPGIVIVCDGGFGGGNMWGATNWSTTGFIAHCNYGLEGGAFFAKGW